MAETRPRFKPTSPIPQRDAPVELRNSDELLAKLTELHRQTEKHDELLGVYETLHESERRFREMIDALPAAIYTTDAEGHLTHFNAAAVELSGRTPELGTDQWCVTWKLFWPDGTPMRHDECPMAVALKEGRILDGQEAIAERPDGTRFWFTPYPRLLRDAEGRIVGGINMLLDITGRKEAERASSLLAAIVDSSDDAIISKSLDGVITSWNKSAERLFGYTAEEAIGQHITLIVPPDRLHEEAAIIERLRRGERIDHFETIRRCKDGTLLNISLTISPVKDSEGRVIGASKVARDVTERKQTETARRQSEERFRTLADNMAQFAWTADSTGWIFWYNKRWYDYTGTTLEEVQGWGWQKVHHPEHVARVVKKIKRCLESGEVWEDTFPLRGKDGEYRWFLSRALPIRDADGKIIRWLGTNTDITEQRGLEEALRKSEERFRELAGKLDAEVRERTEELERRNTDMLEQAEQLRSLSNRLMQLQDDERRRIARELHDSVGQDLAALSMCLEGAKRVAKGTPETAVQKLDEACEIVEKCSSDIRTLSHLLHPPLLEELGLASAIEWYVEGFASRSKIEVNLQMPPGFKRMEPAIELPLFRVLQECLTNIHRHSESKTATVKVEADERKVSLEVSDQGKGLPKRDSTLGSGKRLGVGINGMRERLKDLGGTLELYSTNQGTTVRAAIPLHADARAATL